MIKSLHLLSGSKVLVCGEYLKLSRSASNCINRMNSDGSLDHRFEFQGMSGNDSVHTAIEQANGNIIIAGAYTSVVSVLQNYVISLDRRGRLSSEIKAAKSDGNITSLALEPDGKLLIGGGFRSINDYTCHGVARLHENGLVDESFNTGPNLDGSVFNMIQQADGKILAGGSFSVRGDIPSNNIIRLNNNGDLDVEFDVGTGTDDCVFDMFQQSDGKIVLGGMFNNFNGVKHPYLVRLNPDGSLDNSFQVNTGAFGWVYALEQQADEKIIIAGEFTTINGMERHHIARLFPDGRLDTSFDPLGSTDEAIKVIRIQNDGKVLIAGDFTEVNDYSVSTIARLKSDGEIDKSFNFEHSRFRDERLTNVV